MPRPKTDCHLNHHHLFIRVQAATGDKSVSMSGVYAFQELWVSLSLASSRDCPFLRASSSAPRNSLKPSGQSKGCFSQLPRL